MSLDSFRFVWFVLVRSSGLGFVWFVFVSHWGRWVCLGSSGSSGCALCVAAFFCSRPVRRNWSLGSFGFDCLFRLRPGCRLIRSGSSGSCGCALGVSWIPLVRSGTSWVSLGSFGFVWLVWVRRSGHWVGSASYSSSGCSLCVVGFFRARVVRPGSFIFI